MARKSSIFRGVCRDSSPFPAPFSEIDIDFTVLVGFADLNALDENCALNNLKIIIYCKGQEMQFDWIFAFTISTETSPVEFNLLLHVRSG